MSKVQEIEAAIQTLSPSERAELVTKIPTILPELDGDAAWDRIIKSEEPCPAFTRYLDEVEAGIASGTIELTETSDEEFDRHS